MNADAMQERGDMEGYAVCKRIVKAIAEIRGIEGRTKHWMALPARHANFLKLEVVDGC
jgi:hypothetical protein